MSVARRAALAVAALGALAVAAAQPARSDTAPIADSPDLPWTNPDHQSSVEVLASRIASAIAHRDVAVRCEGDTDWRALVARQRGDPNAELGFVGVGFDASGQLTSLATATELSGQRVCLPLKRFAVAATKPTKCRTAELGLVTVTVPKRMRVKRTVVVGGRRRVASVWVTRPVATQVVKMLPSSEPSPCYPGTGRVQLVGATFWDDYESYVIAIETLAHEAVHLGGVVGLQFSNGRSVGDPLAEAKAQCYGMQWMAFAAEQLGDTPDDAQALATYYWDRIYPHYEGLLGGRYWSAECRPGGALDMRPPGDAAWP
jgi:hypothetical protein